MCGPGNSTTSVLANSARYQSARADPMVVGAHTRRTDQDSPQRSPAAASAVPRVRYYNRNTRAVLDRYFSGLRLAAHTRTLARTLGRRAHRPSAALGSRPGSASPSVIGPINLTQHYMYICYVTYSLVRVRTVSRYHGQALLPQHHAAYHPLGGEPLEACAVSELGVSV